MNTDFIDENYLKDLRVADAALGGKVCCGESLNLESDEPYNVGDNYYPKYTEGKVMYLGSLGSLVDYWVVNACKKCGKEYKTFHIVDL